MDTCELAALMLRLLVKPRLLAGMRISETKNSNSHPYSHRRTEWRSPHGGLYFIGLGCSDAEVYTPPKASTWPRSGNLADVVCSRSEITCEQARAGHLRWAAEMSSAVSHS